MSYKLMEAGLIGINGFTLHPSKNIVSVYVDPVLFYGMEARNIGYKEIKMPDAYHHGLL